MFRTGLDIQKKTCMNGIKVGKYSSPMEQMELTWKVLSFVERSGGKTHLLNLQWLCAGQHRLKDSKPKDFWLKEIHPPMTVS